MLSVFKQIKIATKFLCFVFIIANPPLLHSQDDTQDLINDKLDINKTVAIIPLSTSFDYDPDKGDYSRMLTEKIQAAVEQTKRFIMVERMDLEKVLKIKREQDDNRQEYRYWKNISQGHLVQAGRQLGVEYIFTGNISNVSTPILLSGGVGAGFNFTIKVISVETGKLYVTHSFNVEIGKIVGKNSKKEAINAVLEKVAEPVKKFIDKNFPLEVPFQAIETANKKGVPKTIVIKGGVVNGLRDGQELDIALVGKGDYRKKIGKVKIIGPESHYSICKIIKGHKAIQKQIEADPTIIIAKSKAY